MQKINHKQQETVENNEEVADSPGGGVYRDLAPHTVKPSQTLVTLNGFVTLVTLGRAVSLHPEMVHHLWSEKQRETEEKSRTENKCEIHNSKKSRNQERK